MTATASAPTPTPSATTATSARDLRSLEGVFVHLVIFTLIIGLPHYILQPVTETAGDWQGAMLGFYAISVVLMINVFGRFVEAIGRSIGLVLFILYATVSVLWSVAPSTSGVRTLAFFLTSFFAFYLAARFSLQDLIVVVARVLGFFAVLNLLVILGWPGRGVDANGQWMAEAGIVYAKNTLGAFSVLTVLFNTAAAQLAPGRVRKLHYVAVFAGVILVVGSQSATSLLSLMMIVALNYLASFMRAKGTMFGAVVITAVVTIPLAIWVGLTNLESLTEAAGRDPSLTGRTVLWQLAIDNIGNRPFFGHGFAGFWTDELWSPSRILELNLTWEPGQAHNGILQLALDLGIVGAAFFVLIFARTLFRATLWARSVPGILGRFPLLYLGFCIPLFISERGIVERNSLYWICFVFIVASVGRLRPTLKA